MIIKYCVVCGGEFKVKSDWRKTCSQECARINSKDVKRIHALRIRKTRVPKTTPEVDAFLNGYDLDQWGYRTIGKYKYRVKTVLAEFQKFLQERLSGL